MEDHPRVCGKNFRFSLASAMRSGSPPRVREELLQYRQLLLLLGITPACAGRTVLHISSQEQRKDHPRVCGKNFEQLQGSWIIEGSPPRVREERLYRHCKTQ